MPKLHLYFHTPMPVFKARVNMVSTTYPVSAITFDNVTLGSYTDIAFDMTILLGTTEGADDLGRHRVQKPATADTIYVARSSRGIEDGQLDVDDNAYITILDDFRVWARLPYFNLDNGIDYKDGDVPVGDFNTDLPPIANCGSPFADYIDPDTNVITVELPNEGINLSRAMADGATITDYNWDVKDGTITVGTATDDVITATFPAGFRYVGLTVTDSNGVTHSARVPVLAVDPAADTTTKNFNLSQRLEWQGQTLDVNIHAELDRADYPDGTLVLFWWDEPADPGDRSHMKFTGWVDNESYNVGRDKRGVSKRTTLRCVDVCGRLATLPGFPQALSRIEDESPWSYMPSLDMNKSLWYLGFWHSTALNLADFILPEDGDDYDAMRLDSGAASLFEQMSQQAQKMVPDHYLVCNAKGQMIFQKDWRLEDVGDRPTSAPIITEDYWNDIQIEYNRHPKVHVLRSGAILSSTALDEDELIPVVFSIAPSDAEAFGQGVQEHIENEGLALSQEALNKSEGHRYAMLNSRYGDFTLRDPSGSAFWDYEPAAFNRVQLNIPANLAAQRGLDFTQASGLVKSINVQYQTDKRGTVVKPSVVWVKETSGYPALTHTPEDIEDVGYEPIPTVPPDFGLVDGQELVAGIGSSITNGEAESATLLRTFDFQTPSSSGGPTWEGKPLGITDGICRSFVVDPFSPGYVNGTGAINAWMVGEEAVWRIEDIFGTTPTATNVYTFSVPLSGSGTSRWQSRVIQASFGRFFETETENPWLMVVSYYGDQVGQTGTWCVYSLDAGVTWSDEIQITPHFDTDQSGADPVHDTDVYLSPKTPGLAYTTAYKNTSTPATAIGYMSTDWGETWSAMESATDSPSEPLVRWGLFDHDGANAIVSDYLASEGSHYLRVTSISGAGLKESGQWDLLIAVPEDAVRVEIAGFWFNRYTTTNPTFSSRAGSYSQSQSVFSPAETSDLSFVQAAANSLSSQSYTTTWVRGGGQTEWRGSREEFEASTPTSPGDYCKVEMEISVTTGGSTTATNELFHYWRITEIELEGGEIYEPAPAIPYLFQPGNRPANSIHVPWMNNDDELVAYSSKVIRDAAINYTTLKATGDGVTIDDISPVDATINYGPRRSSWGVRVYDSDPNYIVMAAGANDVNTDQSDDQFCVFVSDDAGVTWTKIIGPLAEAYFPSAGGHRVAFSGSDPNIIYVWGQANNLGEESYILYSTDFGASLDDRSGNISTVGGSGGSVVDGFIGIAGGPTGA